MRTVAHSSVCMSPHHFGQQEHAGVFTKWSNIVSMHGITCIRLPQHWAQEPRRGKKKRKHEWSWMNSTMPILYHEGMGILRSVLGAPWGATLLELALAWISKHLDNFFWRKPKLNYDKGNRTSIETFLLRTHFSPLGVTRWWGTFGQHLNSVF